MKNFIFNIILLFHLIANSQIKVEMEIIDEFSFEADSLLHKDSFDNYYFIKENTLIKKNTGKTNQYQNLSLGRIHSIDFKNPLQLVVFYKDFNTVIILDNQLNEIQKIDGNFLNLVFNNIQLANANRLWFYDTVQQKIGLVQILDKTYRFISTPISNGITNVFSDFVHFYWLNIDNNLTSISVFGKIEHFNQLPPTEYLYIKSPTEYLYKQEGNWLYHFDKKDYLLSNFENSWTNFCLKDGILSIFTDYKVLNYKIKLQ